VFARVNQVVTTPGKYFVSYKFVDKEYTMDYNGEVLQIGDLGQPLVSSDFEQIADAFNHFFNKKKNKNGSERNKITLILTDEQNNKYEIEIPRPVSTQSTQ